MKLAWITDQPGWAYENRAVKVAATLADYAHRFVCYSQQGFIPLAGADIIVCPDPRLLRYIPPGPQVVLNLNAVKLFLEHRMTANLDPDKYAAQIRSVAAVIATNDALAAIARRSNANVTVIPNGVPLDKFCPGNPNPDYRRAFTMGFAGNVTGQGAEYKGWRFFVTAATILAGEGVTERHLLFAYNQIAHEDMPEQFYRRIDALVLPSRGEGCSNVVTEALACGVPVVMTKVGFHGERLTDGHDVLYIDRDLTGPSARTTEQIVSAIRRLIAEPDLRKRLAENGRAFAERHHDVVKVAQAYDAVFRLVAEGCDCNGDRVQG